MEQSSQGKGGGQWTGTRRTDRLMTDEEWEREWAAEQEWQKLERKIERM